MSIKINPSFVQLRRLENFVILSDAGRKFLVVDEETDQVITFTSLEQATVATLLEFYKMIGWRNRGLRRVN